MPETEEAERFLAWLGVTHVVVDSVLVSVSWLKSIAQDQCAKDECERPPLRLLEADHA